MNQVIITGNLGADPDLRYSQNGDPIATFSLAFRLSKEKTGWIKTVCFGKTAEVAEKYLHKGAKDSRFRDSRQQQMGNRRRPAAEHFAAHRKQDRIYQDGWSGI